MMVEDPVNTKLVAVILKNSTTQADNSTDTGSGGTSKPDTASGGGLTSTQLLIIFLVVVFAVLIIFLLVYHYFIKGMRQRSGSKHLAQKSASGSIGEGRDRNIFAHPERHLAVDQSTRTNPHSPASTASETDQNQVHASASGFQQPVHLANLTERPSAPQQAQQVANNNPSGNRISTAASQQPMEQAKDKKSQSEGKKKRLQLTQADPHSILGTLASLRDTLKETEQNK